MEYPSDYHTHSHFSCDSEATMEAMCEAALTCGMRELAITDHAEYTSVDPCYGFFHPASYWAALQHCREAFAGRLTLRAGLECGESHLHCASIAALLTEHEYDFVLGSLHWVGDRPTFDSEFFDGLTLDEGLALYFDELAGLAADGEYDVLAHMDIVRRATHMRWGVAELDLRPHEAAVRRTLRLVAERDKGIEINTSFRRKGIGAPGPSVEVLRWFRQAGGRIVTIGSDGHCPAHVGSDFDLALTMLHEAGFDRPATFSRRRWQERAES